jgi:sugar/nucleoside kinase (ribokinase family)
MRLFRQSNGSRGPPRASMRDVPRPTSSKPNVVVIGDVATDTVVRLTSHHSVDGADTASKIVDSPGGQGANTARWLAHSDVDVQLLASVSAGEDLGLLNKHFDSFGIVAMFEVVDAPPARVISVLTIDGSERSFFTQRGAAAELSINCLERLDLGLVDWIHVSGYLLSNAKGQACYARIRQLANERSIPLSLDPASLSVISSVGVEWWKRMAGSIELLLPNADEARLLTNQPDLVQASADLRMIANTVVVTHAQHGAHYINGSSIGHLAALPMEHVVDPTGAGDAFAAGLISSLAKRHSLAEAVGFGHQLGALCVSQMGAVPPQPAG